MEFSLESRSLDHYYPRVNIAVSLTLDIIRVELNPPQRYTNEMYLM